MCANRCKPHHSIPFPGAYQPGCAPFPDLTLTEKMGLRSRVRVRARNGRSRPSDGRLWQHRFRLSISRLTVGSQIKGGRLRRLLKIPLFLVKFCCIPGMPGLLPSQVMGGTLRPAHFALPSASMQPSLAPTQDPPTQPIHELQGSPAQLISRPASLPTHSSPRSRSGEPFPSPSTPRRPTSSSSPPPARTRLP